MEITNLETRLLEIEKEIEQLQILIRTNNLLLARFILQLSTVRNELGLPKRNVFFKFELLQADYEELVDKFGKQEVDKALYRLDRMLLKNKQQCPHNIRKFIDREITNNLKRREQYRYDKEHGNSAQ